MKACMKAVMLNMTVTDQFHMNLVVKVRLILTICHDIATNPFTQEPGLGKLTRTRWSQVTESDIPPFLEIEDVPTFYWYIGKTEVLNESSN